MAAVIIAVIVILAWFLRRHQVCGKDNLDGEHPLDDEPFEHIRLDEVHAINGDNLQPPSPSAVSNVSSV